VSRTLVPLATPDVSAFAKSLKNLLGTRHAEGKAQPPTHLELLNLLARAAGWRNFSTLKALAARLPPPAMPPADAATHAAADEDAVAVADATTDPTVRKALLQFDAAGRLVRLHAKLSVQQLCMWPLWTLFAAHRQYTEKEVNAILNAQHTFGDPASLRRELVNMGLLARKSDCSAYWKQPQRASPQARALLHAWRARRG
jgi:hypothetical protein